MSVDAHRQASQLMSDAERANLRGHKDTARQLYSAAAELEFEAFQRIPESRPKTRGLIAVSMVNLYVSAGDLAEASRRAYYCMSHRDLPAFAVEELKSILGHIEREEASRKEGLTLGQNYLDVALRGPGVGQGVVPLDLVTLKLQQLYRYVVRVMEWVDKRPFRGNLPPPANLFALCNPVMSEPSIGSFRFEIRFQSPLQPSLPTFVESEVLTPDKVSNGCIDLIERIVDFSPEHLDSADLDHKYRDFFVKLIRGIAPDGREISEIGIARVGTSPRRSLTLRPELRRTITNYISSRYIQNERSQTFNGILRELSLDRAWITLQQDDGSHKYYVRKADIEGFDDLVGPYVNKRVRVAGQWTGRQQPKFWIRDIELDDSLQSSSPVGYA